MNKQFFENNENNGWKSLLEFNDKLKLDKLGRTPTCHYYDASGYTSTGDYVAIEIKKRNQTYSNGLLSGLTSNNTTYTADTIYIEAHKIASMLLDAKINGSVPLYVNFLNDDTVIVFNLLKLNKMPNRVSKKIYSKGYQRQENDSRFELPLTEAFIYKIIDGKWVKV